METIRAPFITPADLQPPVISFPHSHPSLSFHCFPNETVISVGITRWLAPPHLPGESHLRCLATWRALCYCREKHSRAILTPPQAFSPLSFPCLPLYPTKRLPPSALNEDEKSKSTFLDTFNWKEKRMELFLYTALQIQFQSNTSYCITLVWLWFTAVEANWDWKIYTTNHI